MDINKFYNAAYNWILHVGPRLVIAIVFFIIAQWIIRFIRKRLNKALLKRDMHNSLKPFLISLAAAILQILVMLVVLQILGLQLTVFTAIVGGISVAAGLALSGTLQNFTSGILILLLKPYRVGDTIITQGQEGLVKSIQIFHTIITTRDNKTVIIPNSKLSNDVITNLSMEGIRRLDIPLKLNFALDMERLKTRILIIASDLPGVVAEPKPALGVTEILPDGYKMELSVWLNADQYYDVRPALQEKLIHELQNSDTKLPGM